MISRENRGPYASVEGVSEDRKRLSVLDLFLVVLEKKKTFLTCMAIVAVTAVALTLVLPKYYTSRAVVLPPGGPMSLPFGSMIGGDQAVAGLLKSFNLMGGSSGTDQVLSILDSRRLAEKVIKKFDLEAHYNLAKPGKKPPFPEDVIQAFHKNMKVVENDFGNIEISLTDKDPATAQRMAAYILGELDSINYHISKEHAGFSRRFFEERLAVIKSDMDTAQSRFAVFKIKNNYLDLENQVKSTVDVLANIEGEKLAVDVEIEQLRSRMGGDNQRIRELMRERDVLGARVAKYMNKGDGDVLLALKETPTLGIQYAYLYRDVKVQETLYQFVLQMYEQAKMNEANNIPSVRVLEEASYPHKRSRPKRRIIVLLSMFVGLTVTTGMLLIGRWLDNQKAAQTDNWRKLEAIKGHLLFKR